MTNTEVFLSHFPDYVIQTFDDSPAKRSSFAYCGKPASLLPQVLESSNKAGAGIFFSVNRFPSGVRRKELCTGINAWFCESDTKDKFDQMYMIEQSPIPPSLVVESKKSFHMYWLADSTATKDNFRRIQMGLAKHFDGDESMKDIAKVLRVPGYYHMKDPSHPFLVLRYIDRTYLHELYSEQDMLEAFPYDEPEITKPVYERKPLPPLTDDTPFWDILSRADNREMLQRLSGSSLVNGEVFTFHPRTKDTSYIYANGKPCDAWIDEEGYIGSGKRGGPTWIQWVKYYGRTYGEIAWWAESEFIK